MEKYRLIREGEYLKLFSDKKANVDKQTEKERGKDLDSRMNALFGKEFESEEAKARAIQTEMQNYIAFQKKIKPDSFDRIIPGQDLSTLDSVTTSTPVRTPKRVSFNLDDDDLATPKGSYLEISPVATVKLRTKKNRPSSSYQLEAAEAYPPSPQEPGRAAVVRASPGDVSVPALRGKLSRDERIVETNTVYKSRTRKRRQEGGKRKRPLSRKIRGGWLSWN